MDSRKFDEAIGEVPPSTVDVDAAISRGRRAAMVRRVANPVTGAAASVVAIAAAAIVFIPGGDQTGADQNAGGGLVVGSPSPSAQEDSKDAPVVKRKNNGDVEVSIPPGGPEPCDDPPEHPDRPGQMSEALKTAVTEYIPADKLSEVSRDVAGDPDGAGPLDFYPSGALFDKERNCMVAMEGNLLAFANVAQDGGTGNIMAMASFDNDLENFGTCADARAGDHPQLELVSCQDDEGPNGERITATVMKINGSVTSNSVSVLTPDATLVSVHAENVADTAKKGNPAEADAPPLSIEQLRAITLAMAE